MSGAYEAIREYVEAMTVIDTHEHLDHADGYRKSDVLQEYLSHYMSSDLRSAGMKPSEFQVAMDTARSVGDRWKAIEPYWEASRYTGYGRALDIAARKIYGLDGVTSSTIEAIFDAHKLYLAPGHFQRVLKDLCRIQVSLLDGDPHHFDYDRSFFRRVWQATHYVMPWPCSGEVVFRLCERYGLVVRTLDDWLEGFERDLDDVLVLGAAALKCPLAYARSLRFEKAEYAAASDEFAKAIGGWRASGEERTRDFAIPRVAQDYVMHHILRVANEKGLVMQVHTGLLEGNGNTITNSDPSLLSNLFLEYPNVTFDLFHIGYPYQNVTAALCKMFPNVQIDMCWAHIISPFAARQALHDFLDAVPYTKISAFGGDYLFPDGVYGHLHIAKDNVSRVLAEKVAEGVFNMQKALAIAQALFYGNPARIFGL